MAGDDEGLARRNVLGLGVTSLLTDVSTEMMLVALPLYVTGPLGAGRSELGLIEGAAESTASLLKAVSGRLADVYKRRKPLAVLGYSISTVVKPLLAFTTTWPQVLAVRVGDRIGKGVRTSPRDALLADSVPSGARGRAFGIHRSMDTLGAIIGPLIALLLLPLVGYRTLFLLTVIPGALAVLVLSVVVVEPERRARPGSRPPPARAALTGRFKWYLLSLGLLGLGQFSYAFMLTRAKELGAGDELAMGLYVYHNVVYTLVAMPAGVLGDLVGRARALAIGYLMLAVTSLIAMGSWGIPQAIAMFTAFAVFTAFTDTLERALLPELVPEEVRATAYGLMHMVRGLTMLPGNVVFGLIYDVLGARAAFTYSLILALLSLIPLGLAARTGTSS